MPRKKGSTTSSAHKAKISAGVKAYNKGSVKKRDGVISNNQFPRNAAGKKVAGGSGAKNNKNVGAPGSPKSTKKDGNPYSKKAMQANVGPGSESGRYSDSQYVTSDSKTPYGGISDSQKKDYKEKRNKKTGELYAEPISPRDKAPTSENPGGNVSGKGSLKETSARQKNYEDSRRKKGMTTNAAQANRQSGRKTTAPRKYSEGPGHDKEWTEKKNQQDRLGEVKYDRHGGGYSVKANYGGGDNKGSRSIAPNKNPRHWENKDMSPGSKNNPTPKKPKRKRIFRPKGG